MHTQIADIETDSGRENKAGGQQMANSGQLVTNKQVRTFLHLHSTTHK